MVAEQIRRILLKEMGITSWFARTPLPRAAPSHEPCQQNYSTVAGSAQTGAEVVAPAMAVDTLPAQSPSAMAPAAMAPASVRGAAAGMADLAQLLGEKRPAQSAPSPTVVPVPAAQTSAAQTQTPQTSAPQAPAPQTPASPQSVTPTASTTVTAAGIDEQDAERFAFSWFNLDKRLAVLAMLPPGHTSLSNSRREMLSRMLTALYAPWQSLMLVEQSFHWPFADELGLPADANAARQAVDGFIAGRLREQKCAMVLVLCDDTPWFFRHSGEGADVDNSSRLRVHRQFGFAMLSTHSLHAMEQSAGLKRDAWQAMQLLRERLNRDSNQQK